MSIFKKDLLTSIKKIGVILIVTSFYITFYRVVMKLKNVSFDSPPPPPTPFVVCNLVIYRPWDSHWPKSPKRKRKKERFLDTYVLKVSVTKESKVICEEHKEGKKVDSHEHRRNTYLYNNIEIFCYEDRLAIRYVVCTFNCPEVHIGVKKEYYRRPYPLGLMLSKHQALINPGDLNSRPPD